MAPDPALRLQALTLRQVGWSPAQITSYLGLGISSIYRIERVARERGYNPVPGNPESLHLKLDYVKDAPKSGAPLKATADVEQAIVAMVTENSESKGLTATQISIRLDGVVSERTVNRVLKKLKVKRTRLYRGPTSCEECRGKKSKCKHRAGNDENMGSEATSPALPHNLDQVPPSRPASWIESLDGQPEIAAMPSSN